MGVANFREYEESKLNAQKSESEGKLKFATQRSRINNLIEFEKERDISKSLEVQQKKLDQDKEKLDQLTAKLKEARKATSKEEEELNDLKKKAEKAQKKSAESDVSIKEVKRQLDAIRKAAGAHLKQLTTIENQQEQLKNKRHTIYRTCRRDDISIPIEVGELPQDVDPSSAEQMQEILEAESNITLDYSLLKSEAKAFNKAQLEEAIAQYQEKIKKFAIAIEGIAPNLKAIERLQDVEKRLETTEEEFEGAKKSARSAVDDFKSIKEKRRTRFMRAYEHIQKQIDLIYKDLTSGAGAAYLTVDSLEEPYLHGVSYNPMPPNKPFGAIENLSGGEKSVAALALLFAIQSYKPAPFFVLDEIDAALDKGNVKRVATYIRKRSKDMQFILISLKDSLYDSADGLIGICINVMEDSSAVHTLDLTRFF